MQAQLVVGHAHAGQTVVDRSLVGEGHQMRDLRRHAPVGRYRAPRLRDRRSGLPLVARGRARKLVVDVFDRDHPRRSAGHTLKWLLSTMLAGAVVIGLFAARKRVRQ